MPRGRYPKRLYSIELNEDILNQYKRRWITKELYFQPESFPPITVKEFFSVDKKFAIEIGCGDGHFSCALARRNREICFLGIDSSRKLLELAASNAAEDSLSNIRFLQADFRFVAPLLLPETINTFYLHFPAPFTTNRKQTKQTYSKEILSHINRALVVGGRLSFITDDGIVYDFVCEEIEQIKSL